MNEEKRTMLLSTFPNSGDPPRVLDYTRRADERGGMPVFTCSGDGFSGTWFDFRHHVTMEHTAEGERRRALAPIEDQP